MRVVILLAALACSAQPLRQLADQRGIRFGAAADPSRFSETAYAATLSREFNQVEPENAMKFGPIHPAPATYSFAAADQVTAFARDNKMALRGHVLVWHQQVPSWVTGGNTPAQLSAILQEHINTVAGRYAGQVYAWDVVNEAFNDNGSMRSTVWYNTPGIGLAGTGYIEQAFRWARAADPKALLFYNDYSAELSNAKADAIFKMAQDFKTRGVPIDGIGWQMHLTTNIGSLASMEANMKRITDLGLQVQITELDVRLPVDASGAASATSLATQAQIYRDVVALCLKFPLCTLIQTWGFTDKYSWVPRTFAGTGAALPFDAAYQPKPAYNSIVSAMQESAPVVKPEGLTSAASYAGGAVAPGEIVVLFGATFGPASLVYSQADASGMIPMVLSRTRLLFDGVPAPMIYARVGQIAAVVPFVLAGRSVAQVQYEYMGVSSEVFPVRITPTLPGLFTLDASGQGAGAILDASYRVVSAANPARRGDVILLFGTGGGVTSPAAVDGQIGVLPPYPAPVATTAVKIGGVNCPVQYAGGAAGLVAGTLQVNVQVAAAVPAGQQPAVLSIGNVDSQAGVTVWVQ